MAYMLPAHQIRIAALAIEVKKASRELRLIPAGPFRGLDGRPADADNWELSDEDANAIVAMLGQRQTLFVIDYEHQTLHAVDNGRPAPAAATFSGAGLEWRPGDGLYATDVEWRAAASQAIEAGEYLYVSPVFPYVPGSGRIVGLHSAALTNVPAIDGLGEVATLAAARAGAVIETEEAMNLAELLQQAMDQQGVTRAQLGEAAGIDESTVGQILRGEIERPPERRLQGFAELLDIPLSDLQEALPERSANTQALVAALGLEADADDEQVLAACQQAAQPTGTGTGGPTGPGTGPARRRGSDPDPEQYVPRSMFDETQQQVVALSQRQIERDIDDLVQPALQDGRLLPGQEQWARSLGQKDLAALREYLDTAAPIAQLRATQTGGEDPTETDANGLTPNQLAICRSCGIDPEAYAKTLKAQEG